METVRVYKHPYMWEVKFTFGTLEEMIKNRASVAGCGFGYDDNGVGSTLFHLYFGGSFNKEMNSTSRAPLAHLGVEICVGKRVDYWREVEVADILSVECIQSCNWEGVYAYRKKWDEYIKKGLYPIKADWDGKTYIKRGIYKGKDKNGIPVWVGDRYELTDTYRY